MMISELMGLLNLPVLLSHIKKRPYFHAKPFLRAFLSVAEFLCIV